MAKKKDPALMDDSEFDDLGDFGDLDNFDDDSFDFDNFGEDDFNDPDNRKPAGPLRQIGQDIQVTSGAALVGAGLGMANKVRKAMPEVADAADEAINIVSDVTSLARDAKDELRPYLNQSKMIGRQMVGMVEDVVPASLHKRLMNLLETSEEETDKRPSLEEERDENIKNALGNIFQAQMEHDDYITKQNRITHIVDRQIDKKRHLELAGLVSDIRNQANFHTTFTRSVYTAYLQKDLELKYKHMYIAQDTLTVLKGGIASFEKRLDAIKQNTGLPDSVKLRQMEFIKQQAKEKVFNSVSAWGQNLLGNMVKNVRERYLEPLKENWGTINDMMGGLAEIMQQEAEMGGGKFNARKTAAGFIGTQIGNMFGDKAMKKILDSLPPSVKKMINTLGGNSKYLFPLLAQRIKEGDTEFAGSGILQWLIENLGPEYKEKKTFENDLYRNGDQPGVITKRFTTTVEEIIPGYLSKMTKYLADISTDKENEELVFDEKKRDFVSASQYSRESFERAYGNKQQRAAMMQGSANMFRTSMKADGYKVGEDALKSGGESKGKTFEENSADITKVLYNLASSGRTKFDGYKELETYVQFRMWKEKVENDYQREIDRLRSLNVDTKDPAYKDAEIAYKTSKKEIDNFSKNNKNSLEFAKAAFAGIDDVEKQRVIADFYKKYLTNRNGKINTNTTMLLNAELMRLKEDIFSKGDQEIERILRSGKGRYLQQNGLIGRNKRTGDFEYGKRGLAEAASGISNQDLRAGKNYDYDASGNYIDEGPTAFETAFNKVTSGAKTVVRGAGRAAKSGIYATAEAMGIDTGKLDEFGENASQALRNTRTLVGQAIGDVTGKLTQPFSTWAKNLRVEFRAKLSESLGHKVPGILAFYDLYYDIEGSAKHKPTTTQILNVIAQNKSLWSFLHDLYEGHFDEEDMTRSVLQEIIQESPYLSAIAKKSWGEIEAYNTDDILEASILEAQKYAYTEVEGKKVDLISGARAKAIGRGADITQDEMLALRLAQQRKSQALQDMINGGGEVDLGGGVKDKKFFYDINNIEQLATTASNKGVSEKVNVINDVLKRQQDAMFIYRIIDPAKYGEMVRKQNRVVSGLNKAMLGREQSSLARTAILLDQNLSGTEKQKRLRKIEKEIEDYSAEIDKIVIDVEAIEAEYQANKNVRMTTEKFSEQWKKTGKSFIDIFSSDNKKDENAIKKFIKDQKKLHEDELKKMKEDFDKTNKELREKESKELAASEVRIREKERQEDYNKKVRKQKMQWFVEDERKIDEMFKAQTEERRKKFDAIEEEASRQDEQNTQLSPKQRDDNKVLRLESFKKEEEVVTNKYKEEKQKRVDDFRKSMKTKDVEINEKGEVVNTNEKEEREFQESGVARIMTPEIRAAIQRDLATPQANISDRSNRLKAEMDRIQSFNKTQLLSVMSRNIEQIRTRIEEDAMKGKGILKNTGRLRATDFDLATYYMGDNKDIKGVYEQDIRDLFGDRLSPQDLLELLKSEEVKKANEILLNKSFSIIGILRLLHEEEWNKLDTKNENFNIDNVIKEWDVKYADEVAWLNEIILPYLAMNHGDLFKELNKKYVDYKTDYGNVKRQELWDEFISHEEVKKEFTILANALFGFNEERINKKLDAVTLNQLNARKARLRSELSSIMSSGNISSGKQKAIFIALFNFVNEFGGMTDEEKRRMDITQSRAYMKKNAILSPIRKESYDAVHADYVSSKDAGNIRLHEDFRRMQGNDITLAPTQIDLDETIGGIKYTGGEKYVTEGVYPDRDKKTVGLMNLPYMKKDEKKEGEQEETKTPNEQLNEAVQKQNTPEEQVKAERSRTQRRRESRWRRQFNYGVTEQRDRDIATKGIDYTESRNRSEDAYIQAAKSGIFNQMSFGNISNLTASGTTQPELQVSPFKDIEEVTKFVNDISSLLDNNKIDDQLKQKLLRDAKRIIDLANQPTMDAANAARDQLFATYKRIIIHPKYKSLSQHTKINESDLLTSPQEKMNEAFKQHTQETMFGPKVSEDTTTNTTTTTTTEIDPLNQRAFFTMRFVKAVEEVIPGYLKNIYDLLAANFRTSEQNVEEEKKEAIGGIETFARGGRRRRRRRAAIQNRIDQSDRDIAGVVDDAWNLADGGLTRKYGPVGIDESTGSINNTPKLSDGGKSLYAEHGLEGKIDLDALMRGDKRATQTYGAMKEYFEGSGNINKVKEMAPNRLAAGGLMTFADAGVQQNKGLLANMRNWFKPEDKKESTTPQSEVDLKKFRDQQKQMSDIIKDKKLTRAEKLNKILKLTGNDPISTNYKNKDLDVYMNEWNSNEAVNLLNDIKKNGTKTQISKAESIYNRANWKTETKIDKLAEIAEEIRKVKKEDEKKTPTDKAKDKVEGKDVATKEEKPGFFKRAWNVIKTPFKWLRKGLGKLPGFRNFEFFTKDATGAIERFARGGRRRRRRSHSARRSTTIDDSDRDIENIVNEAHYLAAGDIHGTAYLPLNKNERSKDLFNQVKEMYEGGGIAKYCGGGYYDPTMIKKFADGNIIAYGDGNVPATTDKKTKTPATKTKGKKKESFMQKVSNSFTAAKKIFTGDPATMKHIDEKGTAIAKNLDQKLDSIKKKIDKTFTDISNIEWDDVKEASSTTWETVKSVPKCMNLYYQLIEYYNDENAYTKLRESDRILVGQIKDAFEKNDYTLATVKINNRRTYAPGFKEAVLKYKEMASRLANIKGMTEKVVKEKFNKFSTSAKKTASKAWNSFKSTKAYGKAISTASAIKDKAKSAVNIAEDKLEHLSDDAKNFLDRGLNWLAEKFTTNSDRILRINEEQLKVQKALLTIVAGKEGIKDLKSILSNMDETNVDILTTQKHGKVRSFFQDKLGRGVFGKAGRNVVQAFTGFARNEIEDVYRAKHDINGKPYPDKLLIEGERDFRDGLYLDSEGKKRIYSIKDISGPVYNSEGEMIVTIDDIRTGLVDSKGRPIRTAGAALGRGLRKGVGGAVGLGIDAAKGVLGGIKSGASWMWNSGVGMAARGIGNTANTLIGGPIRFGMKVINPFVDIYDQNDMEHVLVTAREQELGLIVFESKPDKKLKSSAEINETMLWANNDNVDKKKRGKVAIRGDQLKDICTKDWRGKPAKIKGLVAGKIHAFGKGIVGGIGNLIGKITGLPGYLVKKAKDFVVGTAKFLFKGKDPYIDVFACDEKGNLEKDPRLTGIKIKRGDYIYADGSVVKSAYGIEKPVYDRGDVEKDGYTKQLVTEDDIKRGLVDANGNRLTSWARKSLVGKVLSGTLGLGLKAVKGLGKLAMKVGGKIGGILKKGVTGIFKSGWDAFAYMSKNMVDIVTTVFKDPHVKVEDLENIVGKRLDKIYDFLVDTLSPKKVAGDYDNDGIRNGSYEAKKLLKAKNDLSKEKKKLEGKGKPSSMDEIEKRRQEKIARQNAEAAGKGEDSWLDEIIAGKMGWDTVKEWWKGRKAGKVPGGVAGEAAQAVKKPGMWSKIGSGLKTLGGYGLEGAMLGGSMLGKGYEWIKNKYHKQNPRDFATAETLDNFGWNPNKAETARDVAKGKMQDAKATANMYKDRAVKGMKDLGGKASSGLSALKGKLSGKAGAALTALSVLGDFFGGSKEEQQQQVPAGLLGNMRTMTPEYDKAKRVAASKPGMKDRLMDMASNYGDMAIDAGKKYGDKALEMGKNLGGRALSGAGQLASRVAPGLASRGAALAGQIGARALPMLASAAGGTGALATAGTTLAGAGSALMGAGAAAGTFLLSNPIGWAILAGAAVYGGYKLLSWAFSDSKEEKTWKKERFLAYGTLTKYDDEVEDLEEETIDIIRGKRKELEQDEIKKFAAKFDLIDEGHLFGVFGGDKDEVKDKKVEYFTTWYVKRFRPIFEAYAKIVANATGEQDELNVNKIPKEQMSECLKVFRGEVQRILSSSEDIKKLSPSKKGYADWLKSQKSKTKFGETKGAATPMESRLEELKKEQEEEKQAKEDLKKGGAEGALAQMKLDRIEEAKKKRRHGLKGFMLNAGDFIKRWALAPISIGSWFAEKMGWKDTDEEKLWKSARYDKYGVDPKSIAGDAIIDLEKETLPVVDAEEEFDEDDIEDWLVKFGFRGEARAFAKNARSAFNVAGHAMNLVDNTVGALGRGIGSFFETKDKKRKDMLMKEYFKVWLTHKFLPVYNGYVSIVREYTETSPGDDVDVNAIPKEKREEAMKSYIDLMKGFDSELSKYKEYVPTLENFEEWYKNSPDAKTEGEKQREAEQKQNVQNIDNILQQNPDLHQKERDENGNIKEEADSGLAMMKKHMNAVNAKLEVKEQEKGTLVGGIKALAGALYDVWRKIPFFNAPIKLFKWLFGNETEEMWDDARLDFYGVTKDQMPAIHDLEEAYLPVFDSLISKEKNPVPLDKIFSESDLNKWYGIIMGDPIGGRKSRYAVVRWMENINSEITDLFKSKEEEEYAKKRFTFFVEWFNKRFRAIFAHYVSIVRAAGNQEAGDEIDVEDIPDEKMNEALNEFMKRANEELNKDPKLKKLAPTEEAWQAYLSEERAAEEAKKAGIQGEKSASMPSFGDKSKETKPGEIAPEMRARDYLNSPSKNKAEQDTKDKLKAMIEQSVPTTENKQADITQPIPSTPEDAFAQARVDQMQARMNQVRENAARADENGRVEPTPEAQDFARQMQQAQIVQPLASGGIREFRGGGYRGATTSGFNIWNDTELGQKIKPYMLAGRDWVANKMQAGKEKMEEWKNIPFRDWLIGKASKAMEYTTPGLLMKGFKFANEKMGEANESIKSGIKNVFDKFLGIRLEDIHYSDFIKSWINKLTKNEDTPYMVWKNARMKFYSAENCNDDIKEKIIKLEKYTLALLDTEVDEQFDDRLKVIASDFGLYDLADTKDPEKNKRKFEYFKTWYTKKFRVVYETYVQIIQHITKNPTDIDPNKIPVVQREGLLQFFKTTVTNLLNKDNLLKYIIPDEKGFEIYDKMDKSGKTDEELTQAYNDSELEELKKRGENITAPKTPAQKLQEAVNQGAGGGQASAGGQPGQAGSGAGNVPLGMGMGAGVSGGTGGAGSSFAPGGGGAGSGGGGGSTGGVGAPSGPIAAPQSLPSDGYTGGSVQAGQKQTLPYIPEVFPQELVQLQNHHPKNDRKFDLNSNGYRWQQNKNPGNVKGTSSQAARYAGRDNKGHLRFRSYSEGMCFWYNYMIRVYFSQGLNTPRSILMKYAPPSENNLGEYWKNITAWSKMQPDQPINIHNEDEFLRFAYAVFRHETGHIFEIKEIKSVWDAAKKAGGQSTGAAANANPAGEPEKADAAAGGNASGGSSMPQVGETSTPGVSTQFGSTPGSGPMGMVNQLTPGTPSASSNPTVSGSTGGSAASTGTSTPATPTPTPSGQQQTQSPTGAKSPSDAVSKYLAIMRQNAQGARYDQPGRMGNKVYDCSSFVLRSLRDAGFKIGEIGNTDKVISILRNAGFTYHSGPISEANMQSVLRPGDVLINDKAHGGHTLVYTGGNRVIGAHFKRCIPQVGEIPWRKGHRGGYTYQGFLRLEGAEGKDAAANLAPQAGMPTPGQGGDAGLAQNDAPVTPGATNNPVNPGTTGGSTAAAGGGFGDMKYKSTNDAVNALFGGSFNRTADTGARSDTPQGSASAGTPSGASSGAGAAGGQQGGPVQGAPDLSKIQATSSAAGGNLGDYVKKFESGNAGSTTIAWDRTGGTSYGTYQFAAKPGGTKAFLDWAAKNGGEIGQKVSAAVSGAGPLETGSKNGAAPDMWRQLAQSNPQAFGQLEHEFVYNHEYLPSLKRIKNPQAEQAIQADRGLQEAFWSTAVQHGAGGAAKIFRETYKPGVSAADWLRTIYSVRGTKFGSSTPKVRASVQNRFKEELGIVLGLSGQAPTGGGGDAGLKAQSATQPTPGGTSPNQATEGGTPASGGGASNVNVQTAQVQGPSTNFGSTPSSGPMGMVNQMSPGSTPSTPASTTPSGGGTAPTGEDTAQAGGTQAVQQQGQQPGAPAAGGGNINKNLFKFNKSSIDVDNIMPILKSRLNTLGQAYQDRFKTKIQINDGKRSMAQQAELRRRKGNGAARPDPTAPHIAGLAVDMNSSDAIKAEQAGLLQQAGLWRPLKNGLGSCPAEAWHVEVQGSRDAKTKRPTPEIIQRLAAMGGGAPVSPDAGSMQPSTGAADRDNSGAAGQQNQNASPQPSGGGATPQASAPTGGGAPSGGGSTTPAGSAPFSGGSGFGNINYSGGSSNPLGGLLGKLTGGSDIGGMIGNFLSNPIGTIGKGIGGLLGKATDFISNLFGFGDKSNTTKPSGSSGIPNAGNPASAASGTAGSTGGSAAVTPSTGGETPQAGSSPAGSSEPNSAPMGGDQGGIIGKYLALMKSHVPAAYSQPKRMSQGAYDCSSFVGRHLKEAGLNVDPGMTTASIPKELPKAGFKFYPKMIGDVNGLQPGDIMWRPGHVETYAGNGMDIGAHSSSSGTSMRKHYAGYNFKGYFRLGNGGAAALSPDAGSSDPTGNGQAMATMDQAHANSQQAASAQISTSFGSGSGGTPSTGEPSGASPNVSTNMGPSADSGSSSGVSVQTGTPSQTGNTGGTNPTENPQLDELKLISEILGQIRDEMHEYFEDQRDNDDVDREIESKEKKVDQAESELNNDDIVTAIQDGFNNALGADSPVVQAITSTLQSIIQNMNTMNNQNNGGNTSRFAGLHSDLNSPIDINRARLT